MWNLNLILVRHGQDEDNRDNVFNGLNDPCLTKLGRQQAFETGEKLRSEKIDKIYSSPLKRACETAVIISEDLRLKFEICPQLIERDFGILTGKRVQDIKLYTHDFIKKDGYTIILQAPGVESFSVLRERAGELLSQLEETHQGQTLLLVTHGDIGLMIRAAFNNWDWKEGLAAPYISNGEIIKLGVFTTRGD